MKKTKKTLPKIIFFVGPPGSGKGTQANLLSDKFGFYHLETSKIGEERINKAKKGEYLLFEGKKYYFEEQKKLWLEGKLWDPPFVVALIEEKIKQLYKDDKEKGMVFSASPRTLYEAEKIIPLIVKLYGKESIRVINLKISEKESIFRNSHRRICQLLRHSILYLKDNKKIKYCPLDGSPLVRREGLDDPETIKKRLKEYQERTAPVIDYFKKQKITLKEINGSLAPALVFKNILKALNLE